MVWDSVVSTVYHITVHCRKAPWIQSSNYDETHFEERCYGEFTTLLISNLRVLKALWFSHDHSPLCQIDTHPVCFLSPSLKLSVGCRHNRCAFFVKKSILWFKLLWLNVHSRVSKPVLPCPWCSVSPVLMLAINCPPCSKGLIQWGGCYRKGFLPFSMLPVLELVVLCPISPLLLCWDWFWVSGLLWKFPTTTLWWLLLHFLGSLSPVLDRWRRLGKPAVTLR